MSMETIPPLLAELLEAPGASGYEDAVQAIVRRAATALGAEVTSDALGSTTALVRGTAGGRTLGLFAHADQVGLAVRTVGADGLLRVAKLAGWRAADARGQRVRVITRSGEVRGVVVAPHEGELTWDALRVDIGALDRDDALALVGPGDWIVLHAPPELLPHGRVLSGALDDRIGIYVGLQVLARLAADPPAWDVALVATGQEETGSHGGARVAAERLAPDVAIVAEVTYDADAPGQAAWGDVRLGGGPTVFRGPVVSPVVGDGLLAAAAASGIEVGIETGPATASDTEDIFTTGVGVACGIVCVPLRYMHTGGEIAQLSDADDAVRLIEAYARSLAPDASFAR
jgi:putative aminopeptidase FrvX